MEKLEQLKNLIQKTKKVKFTDSDFVGKVSKIYKKNFITRAKEDLYTSGKVYKLNTGKFYKGFYHIHKDGTIMTGKKHTDKSIILKKAKNIKNNIKIPKLVKPKKASATKKQSNGGTY